MSTDANFDPALNAAKPFFEGLGLPVPLNAEKCATYNNNGNDCYSGTGGRRLTFVTAYGIVIRITPKESLMEFDNPHFIKPIFSRAAGDFTIDIDPGLECPVTGVDRDIIYQGLAEKYNLWVTDGKADNLCYLPGTDRCFPVMIDVDPMYVIRIGDAAERLHHSVEVMKAMLAQREKPIQIVDNLPDSENPQITTYKPLRDIITDAWPADRPQPDPKGIKEFKRACVAFKKAGKLLTPWVKEENDYCGTTRAAKNYAKRVNRSSGLFFRFW